MKKVYSEDEMIDMVDLALQSFLGIANPKEVEDKIITLSESNKRKFCAKVMAARETIKFLNNSGF